MTDLSRAYQEVQSLPDEALRQELASPSGMLPGYLILSELSDREAMRSSAGGQVPKTNMAQEMLQRRNFAGGGLAISANPMATYLTSLGDADLMQQIQQQQMLNQSGNITPLGKPAAPGPAPNLMSNSLLVPQPSDQPQAPRRFNEGGLASLYPR